MSTRCRARSRAFASRAKKFSAIFAPTSVWFRLTPHVKTAGAEKSRLPQPPRQCPSGVSEDEHSALQDGSTSQLEDGGRGDRATQQHGFVVFDADAGKQQNETSALHLDVEMTDAGMAMEAKVLQQVRDENIRESDKQTAIVKQMQDKAVKEATKPTPSRRLSASGSSSGSMSRTSSTSSASSRRERPRAHPLRMQDPPGATASMERRGRSHAGCPRHGSEGTTKRTGRLRPQSSATASAGRRPPGARSAVQCEAVQPSRHHRCRGVQDDHRDDVEPGVRPREALQGRPGELPGALQREGPLCESGAVAASAARVGRASSVDRLRGLLAPASSPGEGGGAGGESSVATSVGARRWTERQQCTSGAAHATSACACGAGAVGCSTQEASAPRAGFGSDVASGRAPCFAPGAALGPRGPLGVGDRSPSSARVAGTRRQLPPVGCDIDRQAAPLGGHPNLRLAWATSCES